MFAEGIPAEGYPSGLRGRFAKSLVGRKFQRGFESLLLRQINITPTRRGARAVEGNGLENRRASNGTVGSNPTLSAKITFFGQMLPHTPFLRRRP